jgi:hypothetical protein
VVERVLIDAAASAEEAELIRGALRESGFEADVSSEWEKPAGVGNGAFWMVLVVLAVPATAFLSGFGKTIGERAGEAAWEGLKSFVGRLRQARASSTIASVGWVELDDPDGTRIMIGEEADEAYQQLLELDLDARRGWMLLWDDDAKEWYDPNRRYG